MTTTSQEDIWFVPAEADHFCAYCGFPFRKGDWGRERCHQYDFPGHGRCGKRRQDAEDPELLKMRLGVTRQANPHDPRTSEDAVAHRWVELHHPEVDLDEWQPERQVMAQELPRRLDWEREELILACDLVARNGWRQIAATDPRVIELSGLLQRLPLHPASERRPDFRNVNSVARKTADIATNRPGHTGRPTNSGMPTKRVIAEFIAQPDVMHDLAESIRNAAARGDFDQLTTPVPDEDDGAEEGRLLIRRHVSYERDRALRRRKLEEVRAAGKPLACEVCKFDFERTYGERGHGYIECHHIVPLHVGGPAKRKLSDLALLCANCHRIIHARPPWLTPADLIDLMRQQAPSAP